MDIAFALRDLFRDQVDLNNRSFLAFVHGYRTQHTLPDELVSQLPLFIRMAKLLTVRLIRCLDLPPHEDDPAWLQALRLKLATKLNDCMESPS